jgi:hypothetical protein
MYLIALNNNAQWDRVAFANGQFMLMSRAAYDAIGGHETVRDRYCEDVEIARLMKEKGLRPRVSWGNEFCSVRMYNSLGAIFRGWSRIYYAARVGNPTTVLAGMTFVLLCCFTGYAALLWSLYRLTHPTDLLHGYAGLVWLAASVFHVGLMTWMIGYIYRWSGNSARNALLFPVGGSMLLLIFLRALRMCITKKVEWRGTSYSHTMASQLAPAQHAKAS